MNPDDPDPTNHQAGVPLVSPGADGGDDRVATGDRRDDAHFEPAPDGHGVRAHFLVRPDEPPPPDMQTGRVDDGVPAEEGPPVEDLRVAPGSPSVWDARPRDEAAGPEPSGAPEDH